MYERAYGSKYDTKLTTTQIAAKIRVDFRTAVKVGELADCKVSIRTSYYSMGSSIVCRINAASFDILTVAGARYELDAREGNLGERPADYYTAEYNAVVEWFEAALGSYNHNGSDSSIDYYDVNFAGSIECGWELKKADAERIAAAAVDNDDDPDDEGDRADDMPVDPDEPCDDRCPTCHPEAEGGDVSATGHAIAVLRESAKQHRLAGDDGHARACDRAAELLDDGGDFADRDLADRGHVWALMNYGPDYDGRLSYERRRRQDAADECGCGRLLFRSADGTDRCSGSHLYPDQCPGDRS